MTSPVGHVLGGLIAAEIAGRGTLDGAKNHSQYAGWAGLIFVLIAANFADLDFLPGIWVGEFNRFHHQATHSFFAVAVFAGASYWLARVWGWYSPKRWAALGGAVYVSHLLLDSLTTDNALPYGAQFFWPFSSEYYLLPVTPFVNIEHSGAAFTEALTTIFSTHNLFAMAVEAAILLPIWLFLNWKHRQISS